ncbi:MAG: hypothetical protein Q9162_006858 [Coniocarpon cinnabarinum]
MVARLAKGELPANTQVQKDAILAISKSATVFVNYLASHANDRATLNNKKTIQPEDVFEALKDLEFEDIVVHCQEEEKKYAAFQNEKRNDYRRRVKKQKADVDKSQLGMGHTDNNLLANGHTNHVDDAPAAKKPRLSEGASANHPDESILQVSDENDDTVDENDQEEEGDEDEDETDHAEEDQDQDQDQDDLESPGDRHETEDGETSGSE